MDAKSFRLNAHFPNGHYFQLEFVELKGQAREDEKHDLWLALLDDLHKIMDGTGEEESRCLAKAHSWNLPAGERNIRRTRSIH